jgi:hypothetical protein
MADPQQCFGDRSGRFPKIENVDMAGVVVAGDGTGPGDTHPGAPFAAGDGTGGSAVQKESTKSPTGCLGAFRRGRRLNQFIGYRLGNAVYRRLIPGR